MELTAWNFQANQDPGRKKSRSCYTAAENNRKDYFLNLSKVSLLTKVVRLRPSLVLAFRA